MFVHVYTHTHECACIYTISECKETQVLGKYGSAHCNPSTWEVEAGETAVKGHPWLQTVEGQSSHGKQKQIFLINSMTSTEKDYLSS